MPLKELKRIRLDVPMTGVETNIVIYEVDQEDAKAPPQYVGLIYRRGGADLEWSFAGRTIETYSAERAEGFARRWHSENLRARISSEAPSVEAKPA